MPQNFCSLINSQIPNYTTLSNIDPSENSYFYLFWFDTNSDLLKNWKNQNCKGTLAYNTINCLREYNAMCIELSCQNYT